MTTVLAHVRRAWHRRHVTESATRVQIADGVLIVLLIGAALALLVPYLVTMGAIMAFVAVRIALKVNALVQRRLSRGVSAGQERA